MIKLETGCTLTLNYEDGTPQWILTGQTVDQLLFMKSYLKNNSELGGVTGKLEIHTWGWKAFLHFGSKKYLLARLDEALPSLF